MKKNQLTMYSNFMYQSNRPSLINYIFYQLVQNVIGTIPVLPQFLTNVLHRVLPIVCSPRIDVLGVCVNVMRLAFGDDQGNIEGVSQRTKDMLTKNWIEMKLLPYLFL